SVLILRGSWFGSVPFAAFGAGEPLPPMVATGALPFWFSAGNTTRGPALALTSTGDSSRGTIFSAGSPYAIRSGSFVIASDGGGATWVGLVWALMMAGQPVRGYR